MQTVKENTWDSVELRSPVSKAKQDQVAGQESPSIQKSGMDKIKIRGGNKLNGEIKISGAKNAALPIMATAIRPVLQSYFGICRQAAHRTGAGVAGSG